MHFVRYFSTIVQWELRSCALHCFCTQKLQMFKLELPRTKRESFSRLRDCESRRANSDLAK